MRLSLSCARPLAAAILTLVAGDRPASGEEPKGEAWEGLTRHGEPRALHPRARTEGWPRFLGPRDDATSAETHLDLSWDEQTGPRLLWECRKGEGYTSPSIAGRRLYLFHRPGRDEVLDSLDAETGKRFWRFSYPVDYRDSFGYSNGPRASPVLDDDRVYLYGVTSMLHCLEAATGRTLWKRDLAADYAVPQNFFGSGPCPVIWKDLLLQNIGGRRGDEGACVGAFDKRSGEEKWVLHHRWGASYASPMIARVHGRDVLLVLAGGKSRPAHGGLLVIDPATGTLHDEFSWRADKYESVNASSPVVLPGNRIFISETYEKGGVVLEIGEDLRLREVWRAPAFGMHWMTPLLVGDHLYGYGGRNEPDAFLGCYRVSDGREIWRDESSWKVNLADRRGRDRHFSWSFFRGSLLRTGERRGIALGELGNLALIELSPDGPRYERRVSLFRAQQTWSLPVISRGLLYVAQHARCMESGAEARLLCYDLRAGDAPAGPAAGEDASP